MAVIKAYEISFGLSWKTLKDLLIYEGIDALLPREVLRQAFATGLLQEGQLWIDMLEQRNLMAQSYDVTRAQLALALIRGTIRAGAAHPCRRSGAAAMTQGSDPPSAVEAAETLGGLPTRTLEQIQGVLRQYPQIRRLKLYGSRALGRQRPGSDIDLAFSSEEDCSAELAAAFEELPTPYLVDVTHWESLRHEGLREHIERVGVLLQRG